MATVRPRIPISTRRKPVAVLDLAGAVLKKHQSDGVDSPIRGQLKADLEAIADDISEGLKDSAEAMALEKKLEEIYERRNNRVSRVQPILPRVSKALQGEYGTANLRRLGDHGYTVDDTPKAPKKAKAPKA